MSATNIEIKELGGSEIEITGAIPAETYGAHRGKAVKNLSANIELPGFRKGHIPEKVLVQKMGDMAILEEMADLALRDAYPHIIIDNKIDAIGRPKVVITKIAAGNPLEFKITVAIMPEVKLADYKTIALGILSKKTEVSVGEKEVEETILEIQRMRFKREKGNAKMGTEVEEFPPLDDAFVKTLGDFESVADFKAKLTENIRREKERKELDKKRAEVLEALIKDSEITLPDVLIEAELDKMIAQLKGDIAQAGGTFEEYLKHIKKTDDDVRKEWRTDAEKRGKTQLILNKIAAEEKILAPEDEIAKQVKHLLDHYKDANPERARIYVETMLTNEEVFKFLEKQG